MKIDSVTVGLPVKELNKAKEWYRRLFPDSKELEPIERVWEIAPLKDVWLQFFEQKESEISSKVIRFGTDDVNSALNHVKQMGAVILNEPESIPNVIEYFEFEDPWGNILSFYKILD